MEIHYDPAKNARNITERGLPFDRVADFDFETAKICEDIRKPYPERRFVAVGWLDARLHVLCFCWHLAVFGSSVSQSKSTGAAHL